jgi:hypothetical protein
MKENEKKPLTNGGSSPTITPDAYLNCVKQKAKEQGYGTLVIEFKVHEGLIKGAELIGTRQKLSPY